MAESLKLLSKNKRPEGAAGAVQITDAVGPSLAVVNNPPCVLFLCRLVMLGVWGAEHEPPQN